MLTNAERIRKPRPFADLSGTTVYEQTKDFFAQVGNEGHAMRLAIAQIIPRSAPKDQRFLEDFGFTKKSQMDLEFTGDPEDLAYGLITLARRGYPHSLLLLQLLVKKLTVSEWEPLNYPTPDHRVNLDALFEDNWAIFISLVPKSPLWV